MFVFVVQLLKKLIQYLKDQSYARGVDIKKYVYREYREKFPGNFVCNELKRSGVRRPVVDFFAGAEPQISDIMSNNVSRIAYFSSVLEVILSGNITLITGIPGCGKSTLLMQLAFSNELSGRKFWFNNIIKQEKRRICPVVFLCFLMPCHCERVYERGNPLHGAIT